VGSLGSGAGCPAVCGLLSAAAAPAEPPTVLSLAACVCAPEGRGGAVSGDPEQRGAEAQSAPVPFPPPAWPLDGVSGLC
jgi:hypothetical protein